MFVITNVTIKAYFFTCLVLLLGLPVAIAYGQSTTTIGATAQLSICGNHVAESGEDCDNEDLAGKNCTHVGFARGTLTCDMSCSFDMTKCFDPLPSPSSATHTTPSLSRASSASPLPVGTVVSTSPGVQAPRVSFELPFLPKPLFQSKPTLPSTLSYFDINSSQKIETHEVYDVVKKWVTEWHLHIAGDVSMFVKTNRVRPENSKCDINHDTTCDVEDLSILLYYVEQ